MKKASGFIQSMRSVFSNSSKLLKIAWEADPFVIGGFYLTGGVSALFPIILSYVFKILLDDIISAQKLSVTVPLILVSVLASRYLVMILWDFVMWGLKNTYFDYLFRYRMQNVLSFKFFDKVSTLDIAHHENTKVQDLIVKTQDTFTWRVPDYLRQLSYILSNIIAYIISFLLLMPYGLVFPFLITIATIPRLYLRSRFGRLEWSFYGAGVPETRKLYYLRWLMSYKMSVIESRIMQSQKELIKKFHDLQEHLYSLYKKPVVDFVKIAILPEFLEVGVLFAFAYVRLPSVLNGQMTVGDFTFFISLLDRIGNSAIDMVLNFGEMYADNLYVNHYFEVLDLPKLIKESPNPKALSAYPNPPKIEFKNVSFSYPGTKKKVLKNVSFVVEPGKNLALVGANGAGKTTIVKLICRFYDPTSGKILVDGIDLKELKFEDWYKYLGTLFQEFMHYDFTVRENIMLGSPGVVDEDKMKKVARASGASEFIERMPKKYDQLLGRQFEGGTELSQGQWQKIAIARAFYEESPILILDEPTSAIDAEAEYKIFNSLNREYKDKTLLLVSHRFSTVRSANKIIVLKNGEIAEEGDHNKLLKKDGLYARMFKRQAAGYK